MDTVYTCYFLFSFAQYQMTNEVLETLRTVFKKERFRYPQEEIVHAVIKGLDALVLLPTGHGKSLTYQLPAVVPSSQGKTTIVISPLLALMDNQVSALRRLNVSAKTLNGNTRLEDRRRILQDVTSPNPKLQLLYVSPELCATKPFREVLFRMYRASPRTLARFVIDEAHCCVEWGFGFRKDYTNLAYLRETYPEVPITALTATAPPTVQTGIINILGLHNSLKVFAASVNRTNLHYEVRFFSNPTHESDILPDIERFLTAYQARRLNSSSSPEAAPSGPGIIYCRRKDTVELVAATLREHGFGAQPFHGSLSAAEKERVMSSWLENAEGYEIVVATVAFGMGVDKPDVRFVIHVDLPGSVETYYQASGRAGRDGKGARCILYYSREDAQRAILLNRSGKKEAADGPDMGLQYLIQYCEQTSRCRHLMLCSYFEQSVPRIPTKEWCEYACDYCKDPKQLRRSVLALTEKDDYYD